MSTPFSDDPVLTTSKVFDTPIPSLLKKNDQFKHMLFVKQKRQFKHPLFAKLQQDYMGPLILPSRIAAQQHGTLCMPAVLLASGRQVQIRLRPLWFILLYLVCLVLNLLFMGKSILRPLNVYLTYAWASYLPIALIGIIGAIGSLRLKNPPFEGKVTQPVIFMIPTIARLDTVPALKRVVDSILLCAPQHLSSFTIHIITEEDAVGIPDLQRVYRFHPQVTLIIVPAAYRTVNGTKYKSRANQYALEYRHAYDLDRNDVFVYHGDDDTGIGPDTIWSIAHFLKEKSGRYDLAQGVLTYPHQLCPSWFCKLADSLRPADDLTRFLFFTGLLGRPLAGLHGEHLLVRASVEHTIGWDFGASVKVEDAYFGMYFSQRYPGRSTFLPSCSYGASPATVSDLVKQRRRWAAGLFALFFDRRISIPAKWSLCYATFNWVAGILQHVGVVLILSYFFNGFNTSPAFQVFIYVWCFNLAYFLWLYLEGLRMNLDASQAARWTYFVLPWIVIMLMPAFSFVEAWAALLGLKDFLLKKKGFEVISKKI